MNVRFELEQVSDFVGMRSRRAGKWSGDRVTPALLNRLEAQIPNLIKGADLIAGTSTVGIVALDRPAGRGAELGLTAAYASGGLWVCTQRSAGGLHDFQLP